MANPPDGGTPTPHQPTLRRDWLDWHVSAMLSCALILIWWYLTAARIGHFLPAWVPVNEGVVMTPAAVCAVLGICTILAAGARRRYAFVLEGLFAIGVGVVGCLVVSFLYVMN